MDHNSATSSAIGTNSIENKLVSYASAVKSYSGNNALEFWKNAESTFPLLAPLAEDLISAPGSQAYVERVFSVCGDLTSGKKEQAHQEFGNKENRAELQHCGPSWEYCMRVWCRLIRRWPRNTPNNNHRYAVSSHLELGRYSAGCVSALIGLVTLTFDLLTMKLVRESHQRWGTFLPNLGTL